MNLHLACQSGPTYISLETIAWLIDGVIEREHHYSETGEDIDADMLMDRGCGYPSVACAALWATFETELEAALMSHLQDADRVQEFMCADGPYAVFMTLNGEGVGVQDKWVDEAQLCDSDACDILMEYLTAKLSHFADCTGSGSLNEIHEVCAYRDSED